MTLKIIYKKLYQSFFIALFLISPVKAENCDMDVVWDLILWDNDYDGAIAAAEPCAVEGDSFAQLLLGEHYYFSDETSSGYTNNSKDMAEAFYWFEKSALQGDPSSQFHLGTMYEEGQHVKKDIIKARDYYLESAKQDNSDAQFQLGLMYGDPGFIDKFFGLELDYQESLRWFKKSAENELSPSATAAYNVYVIYSNGWVSIFNTKEIDKWLKLSASLGDEQAIKEWNELASKQCTVLKAKKAQEALEDFFVTKAKTIASEGPSENSSSLDDNISSECEFYDERF